jgi:hypothetical protein
MTQAAHSPSSCAIDVVVTPEHPRQIKVPLSGRAERAVSAARVRMREQWWRWEATVKRAASKIALRPKMSFAPPV